MNRNLRIIYMGTPEFAVEPLKAIIDAGYQVLTVITAPDKPAGRGQKIHLSPVKEAAMHYNIPVLQPLSLKSPEFIGNLKSFNANLQVVVAFRMLPEVVWQMPEFGTLNLHASLLPQYRGAAPINHAIINGETETGLTTFFIEKEIDTGNIILTRKLPILPSDDAGALHDRLMYAGGSLMLETLKLIQSDKVKLLSQQKILPDDTFLNQAPKIFKADCKINWNSSCLAIHNLVRGLSPLPGAFSNLIIDQDSSKQVKIFRTTFRQEESDRTPGSIETDFKKSLSVRTADGFIEVEELQMEGKKRLNITEFLRGQHLTGNSRFGL
ncbi:MAG: methionyl-tRNA formyltransferase [Bacteroidota bacterium]